jgi:hypothetical protein
MRRMARRPRRRSAVSRGRSSRGSTSRAGRTSRRVRPSRMDGHGVDGLQPLHRALHARRGGAHLRRARHDPDGMHGHRRRGRAQVPGGLAGGRGVTRRWRRARPAGRWRRGAAALPGPGADRHVDRDRDPRRGRCLFASRLSEISCSRQSSVIVFGPRSDASTSSDSRTQPRRLRRLAHHHKEQSEPVNTGTWSRPGSDP